MKRGSHILGLLIALVFLITGGAWAGDAPTLEIKRDPLGLDLKADSKAQASAEEKARIQESYGKIPLYFIKNNGQVDKKVKFYEKGAGHATYFTKDGIYLNLTKAKDDGKPVIASAAKQSPENANKSFESEVVKLTLKGANKNPEITALDEQAGKINYFVGNDKSKWRTNVPTYGTVLYKEVYKGIDVKYYGNNSKLEYDVIVRPGADPKTVKFAYEGIKGLKVTEEGDLEIALKEGNIHQKRPYIYQDIDGKRVEVEGKFVILDKVIARSEAKQSAGSAQSSFIYGFEVASYDKKHELVIDPYIVYSTYLGGDSYDRAYDVAFDNQGNAYVVGTTNSSNFPTNSIARNTLNVFVTKINASGSLGYHTELWGNSSDVGTGIAVDSLGDIYITGYTGSGDFPTGSLWYQGAPSGAIDAFIVKLNSSGSSILYSTFLGGSSNDYCNDIAIDGSGYAYITGYSPSLPTHIYPTQGSHAGMNDVFVAKVNTSPATNGTGLIYVSILGGGNNEYGNGIAVDISGNTYITGSTNSSDFPVVSAFYGTYNGNTDAFIAKIDPNGGISYSTFLGSPQGDIGNDITVDSVGNAYVTGNTAQIFYFPSTGSAITSQYAQHNGISDVFVTKINNSGNSLIYSVVFGGDGADIGQGIAIDASGNAYVTGVAQTNFPLVNPIQASNAGLSGTYDVFITKIDPSGNSLVFSTYLGGNGNDYSSRIAVDSASNAYVAGYLSDSTNFPVVNPIDGTFNGGIDAFVTKISFNTAPTLSYSTEAGYGTDGVSPDTGTATNAYTYKVVYTDADNNAPTQMTVYVDGVARSMSLDTGAAAALHDGDYTNGEQYVYSTLLAAGPHTYYFVASDGTSTVNLPATGTLSGPTVSDLSITTAALPSGEVYVPYSTTLSATGGTAPYTWSVPYGGLPAGLTLNSSTGVISGTPASSASYGFTAYVTDASAMSYAKSFSLAINPDSTVPTGSVTINSGDASTTTTSVTLTLSATDNSGTVSQMRFSNDNVTWSAWEAYSASKAWTLSAGEGEKTVYAQFKDAAGNVSVTSSDTITFILPDTTAPVVTSSLAGGAYFQSITVSLTANEAATIYYTTDGSTPTTASAVYSTPLAIAATTILNYFAVDGAGNASAVETQTYTITGGEVWGWGNNLYGQLGDGTVVNSSVPVQAPIYDALSIASGDYHTIALKLDGTVWGWGANNSGQLGNGTVVNSSTPVQAIGLSGITSVSAGTSHSLAVRNDGTLWGWGINNNGQLGDGTTANRTSPAQAAITAVASADGGKWHTVALKSDGTVWSWGRNNFGQLGNGTTADSIAPVQVSALGGVIAVTAGDFHSMALKSDGTVWAWGRGNSGQLGNNLNVESNIPVQVSGLTGVIAISAGGSHSVALKSDGTVWAWGSNGSGQLGNNTFVNSLIPVQVSGLTGVTGIAAGVTHTVALRNDGTVWAWGSNASGELGDGTLVNSAVPVQVSGLTNALAVAAGNGYSAAMRRDSTPPTGSMVINADASYTSSVSVTINLTCDDTSSGCGQMRFSNDNVTWSAWEAYSASKSWTLTAGNGTKTVYAQLKDNAENASAVYTDTIVLSTIDLAVSSISAAASAYTGTYLSLPNTVVNNGTGSSASSFVKFYLSADTVIDPATDYYLGQRAVSALAGGASSSASTSLLLPVSTAAGTYYVGAVADATSTNSEYNESNNISVTGAINVTSGIDFSFTAFSAASTVYTGTYVAISNTLKNNGPGTSVTSYVKFYLSADNVIDPATDTYLGQRSAGSLAGGASSAATTSILMPVSTAAGTYYIGAVSDATGTNPESNETNNISVTGPVTVASGIDFSFTALSAPASAYTGTYITVPNTVLNSGPGTSVTSYVKFYISTDTVIDPGTDVYLGQRSISPLAGGASSSASTSLLLPVSTAAGTYYVGAISDATSTNPESNEDNNIAIPSAIVVTSGIDFSFTDFSAASNVYTGTNVAVSNTVKNNGPGTSVTSYVKFYLSTDNAIDPATDVYLGQRSISTLAGGAFSSASTSLLVPVSTTPGTYYIGAVSDATGTNPESNEDNNIAVSSAITVASGIDFSFTALSAPASADSGTSIVIPNTVLNSGTGTSVTSYVKFYLSTDNVIDPATDVFIGQRSISTLAGGASSSASTSLLVPVSTTAGTYYIGAVSDATGTNPESNEDNNIAVSSAITIASGIDFSFIAFSAPASADTGMNIIVPNTVLNSGTGTSVTSYVKFYLSTDTVIDPATDVYLGQRSVSTLAGGASSIASTSLLLPVSTAAGTYYVGAISDATGTNPESNEDNNIAVSSAITVASGIDFSFTAFSAPASADTGTYISIPNTVVNSGTGTSVASYVKFYLSTDAVIDPVTDVYLGQRSVAALASGTSSSASTSLLVPVSTTAGTYYIGAISDATSTNPESNEDNNIAVSSAITVASGIDLSFTAFSAPASVDTGTYITVTNTVLNSGPGTSVASSVKFYLSTDAVIDPATDVYLGQRSVAALAGGASSSASTSLLVPVSTTAGTYYIGAVSDATGTNPESNEDNNIAVSSAITVASGIDFSFTAFSAPASADTGTYISIPNTVVNSGPGASVTSYVKFYLSTDTVIDPTDVYLGQRSVSALASGASSSVSTNILVPASTAAGEYYIGAIADATDVNPESDETNNTAYAGPVTVGP